jgi:AraC-like DNA-binding protein
MSASDSAASIALERFPLGAGEGFELHEHDAHQLAWARDGVLMVAIGERSWMLPPSLALWIPAGTPHSASAVRSAATLQGVYLPARIRPPWPGPEVVAVTPLLRELIDYLCRDGLDADARTRAEALVPSLLEPAAGLAIDVPMPGDGRAARIAAGLELDPGDPRDLAAWGRAVGSSARTLSRIFAAETGLGFGQWRSRLRLRASLAHLAAGEPVGTTAALVGFASASAYIAAFSQLTGSTPGAYLARLQGMALSRHDVAAERQTGARPSL